MVDFVSCCPATDYGVRLSKQPKGSTSDARVPHGKKRQYVSVCGSLLYGTEPNQSTKHKPCNKRRLSCVRLNRPQQQTWKPLSGALCLSHPRTRTQPTTRAWHESCWTCACAIADGPLLMGELRGRGAGVVKKATQALKIIHDKYAKNQHEMVRGDTRRAFTWATSPSMRGCSLGF